MSSNSSTPTRESFSYSSYSNLPSAFHEFTTPVVEFNIIHLSEEERTKHFNSVGKYFLNKKNFECPFCACCFDYTAVTHHVSVCLKLYQEYLQKKFAGNAILEKSNLSTPINKGTLSSALTSTPSPLQQRKETREEDILKFDKPDHPENCLYHSNMHSQQKYKGITEESVSIRVGSFSGFVCSTSHIAAGRFTQWVLNKMVEMPSFDSIATGILLADSASSSQIENCGILSCVDSSSKLRTKCVPGIICLLHPKDRYLNKPIISFCSTSCLCLFMKSHLTTSKWTVMLKSFRAENNIATVHGGGPRKRSKTAEVLDAEDQEDEVQGNSQL